MWIDSQGIRHTVAVPDPTELMSDEFRASLDNLVNESADEVCEMIAEQELAFYKEKELGACLDSQEHGFEGLSPPTGLLDEPATTIPELRTRIRNIDWRWRLDVICALDDYVS